MARFTFSEVTQAFQSLSQGAPQAKPEVGLADPMPLAPRFTVSVSGSGLSTSRALGEGEFTVGNGLNADLVVPALSQEEVLLLRFESIDGAGVITVVPLVPGVRLRDRELRVNVPVPAGDRATIEVETTTLTVQALAAPLLATAPARRTMPQTVTTTLAPPSFRPLAGLPLAMLLAAGALAALGMGGWRMTQSMIGGLERMAQGGSPALTSPEGAARDLGNRVGGGWLSERGEVKVQDGRVVFSGSVTGEESARLKDVAGSVQRRSKVPVVTELTVVDGPAMSQVAAVLLAPRRLVVGRDGKRYGVGDRLPDGTLVSSIDETAARFVKQGIEETLRF